MARSNESKNASEVRSAAARPGGGFHGRDRFLREAEKPKDFVKTVKRLVGFFEGERASLALIFLLVLASSATALVSPYLIGRAIDMLDNSETGTLSLILAALLLIYFSDAITRFFQGWIVAGTSQRLVKRIRGIMFNRLQSLPIKFFDSHTHGELMSRLSNDTDNIAGILGSALITLASTAVVLIGVLAIMLWISPLMTFFSLVSIPLFFVVNKTITSKTKKYFREQQATLGMLNAKIEEDVTGIAVIKAYGHEKHAISAFAEINERLRDVSTKALIWSGFIMPIMNVINNLSLAVVALAGGVLSVNGYITVGVIAMFIQYSRQFGRPLNELASTYNMFQSALASAERVFAVMDEEPEPPDAPNAVALENPNGEIIFDGVDFSYYPGEPVLSDVSFNAKRGETVALVGPTGAGKTTVVNLVTRFYDANSGEILLDGLPLARYARDSLRRAFGVVLQDTYLFTGTIFENIRYGRGDATDEQVIAAAKTVGAHHFITQLPEGYQTILTENSRSLSQGQRQLLAIARCVLADPAILILDEATSNVDTRTEIRIQQAMGELMRGRTSFVIAHRLRTIVNADNILVVRDGRIAEQGTHERLLERGGAYKRMFEAQAGRGKADV